MSTTHHQLTYPTFEIDRLTLRHSPSACAYVVGRLRVDLSHALCVCSGGTCAGYFGCTDRDSTMCQTMGHKVGSPEGSPHASVMTPRQERQRELEQGHSDNNSQEGLAGAWALRDS